MRRIRHQNPRNEISRLVEEYVASPNEVRAFGLDRAISLLRHMPAGSREGLLRTLGERDPRLRRELENRMFTFNDLLDLDDFEFRQIIDRVRSTDRDLWPLALRSCSILVKDRLLSNMSSGMRDEVEYRLDTMGRRAVSQVHQAQQRIVLIAQEMTEEGIVNFGSSEKLV